MLRIGLGVLALVVLLGAGLTTTVQLRWERTFDAPYPDLRASDDPEVIARGEYLVFGPAHCAYCHTPYEAHAALDAGETPPLMGGLVFEIPLGRFHTPNLTPDPETGIGRYSDGELARVIRHGVRPDGQVALPFMEFQNLSDEDLVAVLSYLRSKPPVHNPLPPHRYTTLGKAIKAFLLEPVGPAGTPGRTSPPVAPTIERGEYLVNAVAGCAGCHTVRDMRDGSYIGPRLAGGMEMDLEGRPDEVSVTPNLTPDPETGILARRLEDSVVELFETGSGEAGSHMPWGAFARMHADDVRAIYRYLLSLDPVRNETGPTVRPRAANP